MKLKRQHVPAILLAICIACAIAAIIVHKLGGPEWLYAVFFAAWGVTMLLTEYAVGRVTGFWRVDAF